MTADPGELLRAVVANGTGSDLAAWAATGRAGVQALHDELAGLGRVDRSSRGHGLDAIDQLSVAASTIAGAAPDAFIEIFADDRWTLNTFVLDGLGVIDDDRATARLVAASTADEWSVRMAAVIGLGGRPSPVASAVLGRSLSDREYLVRYHALRSLERVGSDVALPDLDAFHPSAEPERSMRDQAIDAIRRRSAGSSPTG